MKLCFSLSYHTRPGEKIHVILKRKQPPFVRKQINIALSSSDGKNWRGEGLFLLQSALDITYHYEVRSSARTLRCEWPNTPRSLRLDPAVQTYHLYDHWQDLPDDSWLYASCFTDVFKPCALTHTAPRYFTRTLVLCAQTTRPGADEELCLCGNLPALGDWDAARAHVLTQTTPHIFCLYLDAQTLRAPFEYKFLLRNKHTGNVLWEQGDNRRMSVLPTADNHAAVYHNLRPQFEPQKPFRAAGVVIPVFSLRSEGSSGAGDFGDLTALTDWASRTGQRVIQLLPVNDTTHTGTRSDSYPYKAISVYALHPLYADLRQLPAPDTRWEKERRTVNKLPQVDYERTLRLKHKALQYAFEQEGEHVLGTPQFHRFFQQNAHWLPAYAMFCVLRDTFHTADFTAWPQYRTFEEEDLHRFCTTGTEHEQQVHFWYYVQFILHTQLLRAAQYARARGIIFKGDLPIGISPHSVDAWTEPALFHLNAQAGAPPDDFSADGQNWGFPTYNWTAMARDNYRWWRRRLQHMAQYFDAYRIDHVLGFFRIWEIPASSVDGLLGQFSPALPLTVEEIQSYGLPFTPRFLQPDITEDVLEKLFGPQASRVKRDFLAQAPGGRWQLRPDYATQRQIDRAPGQADDKKTQLLRRGLFALTANVLFVADRTDPHRFHPRIDALNTPAFEALNEAERSAFARLYNDYFFRRHNEFWKQNALTRLEPVIQSTRMLCCAEDLGMVPDCVAPVLQQLHILSLQIQRMPKKLGERFDDTRTYPYLSVATPSTHDMSVLRGWWQENKMQTQQFWRSVLGKNGPAPQEATPEICREILAQHLNSPSMLALIGFQDWTALDGRLRAPDPAEERINVPADPRHYWRYRMHLTLEELLDAHDFNDMLKEMIRNSGR